MGVGDHAVDFGVVVFRIVMEKEELFHIAFEGEFHNVVDTAVTPSAMLGIFVAIILGVHDEDVDVFDKCCDLFVFITSVFKLGGVTATAKLSIVAVAEMRFIVGEKSDGTCRG